MFNFTHCLQHVCNLLFIVLLYWSCAVLFSFSLYLSAISVFAAVQLFTHSLHFLHSIKYSCPEILIMNKRTKKCCPPLSQFSPVTFDCVTVQYHLLELYCHTISLLFNPDVLSVRPDKPVTNTGIHFQYKLRI